MKFLTFLKNMFTQNILIKLLAIVIAAAAVVILNALAL